jgi:hypothetical protein
VKKDDYCQHVLDSYRPAESLLKMVPDDRLDWKPGPSFMSLGQLIYHLSVGIGSELRKLINGDWSDAAEMEHGNLPACSVQEALGRLEQDKTNLREILSDISEEDFANKVVSVPWGWTAKMEIMALDFKDHFVNHKMQLFTYLKLLGYPVNTNTLYFG